MVVELVVRESVDGCILHTCLTWTPPIFDSPTIDDVVLSFLVCRPRALGSRLLIRQGVLRLTGSCWTRLQVSPLCGVGNTLRLYELVYELAEMRLVFMLKVRRTLPRSAVKTERERSRFP